MYEDPYSAVTVHQSELRREAEQHRLVALTRACCSPAAWRRLLTRGRERFAPPS